LIRRLSNLPDGTTVLAFSPDGKTLAWGEQRHPGVHLIELASGRERYRFSGQRGWISALAFASDGKTLASASQDTTVVIWDLTGRLVAKDRWGKPLSPSELEATPLSYRTLRVWRAGWPKKCPIKKPRMRKSRQFSQNQIEGFAVSVPDLPTCAKPTSCLTEPPTKTSLSPKREGGN